MYDTKNESKTEKWESTKYSNIKHAKQKARKDFWLRMTNHSHHFVFSQPWQADYSNACSVLKGPKGLDLTYLKWKFLMLVSSLLICNNNFSQLFIKLIHLIGNFSLVLYMTQGNGSCMQLSRYFTTAETTYNHTWHLYLILINFIQNLK